MSQNNRKKYFSKTTLSLIAFVFSVENSFANTRMCLNAYNNNSGKTASLQFNSQPNIEITSGAHTEKISQLLGLSPNSYKKAFEKLSREEQAEVKTTENRIKELKTKLDRMSISEERAIELYKDILNSGFLFSELHEGVFLHSIFSIKDSAESFKQINISRGSSETIKNLKVVSGVFASDKGSDLELRAKLVNHQKAFLIDFLDISDWSKSNRIDRNTVYEKYKTIFSDTRILNQKKFYSMMDSLVALYAKDPEFQFLSLVLDNSGPELIKMLSRQYNTTPFYAGMASAGLATGAAVFSHAFSPGDGLAFPVIFSSFLGTLGGLISAFPLSPTLHGTGRWRSALQRRSATKTLLEKIKSTSIESKVETVEVVQKQLEADEVIADYDYAKIKTELIEGINSNPVLIPLWGSQFSDGAMNIIKRLKNLEYRKKMILGETDKIIESLNADNNNLSPQALAFLNSVSREKLLVLFVDFENLKQDLIAMALALDTYEHKLAQHELNFPGGSPEAKIIQEKKQKFTQQAMILDVTAQKLITNSDLVDKALSVISELDSALEIDSAMRLLNE